MNKFGETLSKGAMIWYYNLPPNYINLFALLEDAFVKAYTGTVKVETRKLDMFKVKVLDETDGPALD